MFGYWPYQAAKFEKNAEKFYKNVYRSTDTQTHAYHTHVYTHTHTHTHTHTQRERDRESERETNNSKSFDLKKYISCVLRYLKVKVAEYNYPSDWKLLHQ